MTVQHRIRVVNAMQRRQRQQQILAGQWLVSIMVYYSATTHS